MRMTDRRQRPRGFSLLEVLIVVALIGIAAMIGFGQFSATFKRQRLVGSSAEMKTIAQSVRTTGQNRNAMAFLRIAPANPDGTIPIQVLIDSNGNSQLDVGTDAVTREYSLPADLNLASPDPDGPGPASSWDQWVARAGNDHYIACDFLGRTIDPVSQTQVVRPLTLELTHDDMISGRLTPQVTWTLTVNPVWNAALAQRLGS